MKERRRVCQGAQPLSVARSLPDPVYNNRLVTQLINKILLDGKKSIAERIVYGAFDIVEKRSGNDPLAMFKKAMDNVRPALEVKPKRVGGATYQVPVEVNSAPLDDARDPLDRRLLAASAARRRWPSASRTRSWTPQQHGRVGQEARGPVQDGRVEPGLRHYRW